MTNVIPVRFPRVSERWKGYFNAVAASVTYGMIPLFTLPLYAEGLDADSVLFYRYTLAIPMLGILMKIQKQSFILTKKELLETALAGIIFAFSSLSLFLSYKKMDAGIASTLLFMYPVMVAVLMAALFHEKLTLETCTSIVLALGGISLLYRQADGSVLSMTGILLVMFSALAYAVYIIGVNRSELKHMPGAKLTFYALLSGVSVYLIRLRFGMDLQMIPSWRACGILVFFALIPTVVSLVCTAVAIHCAGATPTAILGALEPVTAIFFGVLLFGEHLSLRIVTGVILILTGVSLIICGKTMRRNITALFRKLTGKADGIR